MKKTDIKNIIKEAGIKSTLHSIPKIAKSENLLITIIWLLSTLGSVGFCSYLMYKSISDYLSFDVVTKIRVIKEKESEFPAITLCNVEAFNSYWVIEEYKNFLLNSDIPIDDWIARSKFIKDSKYLEFLNNLKVDLDDSEKKTITYPFEEFLRECWYNYGQECNENDFEQYYDYYFGNCYRFNSGYNLTGQKINIKNAESPGLLNGLIAEILINIKLKNWNYSNINPQNYAKCKFFVILIYFFFIDL